MDKKMPFKIGIIGCGAATSRYYLPVLKKFPGIHENLYLVDKNLGEAEKLAKKFEGGAILDDHRKIIDKVRGVIVVLPHFFHYSVSMDFLNRGVNVLCEKPLAESIHEVREMNRTAKEKHVALCVNNTMRMSPSARRVREIIASGQIGQLKSISFCEGNTFAWPSLTGFYVDPKTSSKGVLLDLGSHVIDLVCWWLGEKPKLIDYKDDSFGGPEAVALVRAELNGCKVDVFLNRLSDLKNGFRVIGDLGSIEGKLFEWKEVKVLLNSGKIINGRIKSSAKVYSEFFVPIVHNFLGVIEGREKPLVSGNDVENSIELIEECYKNRSRFELPWDTGLEKILEN